MNQAFDPNTVRHLLLRGIQAGHWTLAHLDQPSEGWLINEYQSQRIYGFTHPPHRNIARDPITNDRIQPIDPRDFDVAAATSANHGSGHADLLPPRWPDIPGQRDAGDLGCDQDSHRPRADHELPQLMGATGTGLPLCAGDFLEDPEGESPDPGDGEW